ncbi:MAG TPA: hypothetical protein VFS39_08630 [Nitrospira sp.]|nr:hypothetical protein [Nitrospira sp.]
MPLKLLRTLPAGALMLAAILNTSAFLFDGSATAGSLDQLTDLTGHANVVITLIGRDNFTSEYRYHVTVRNNSADHLMGDSLVVVLDKITNLAGEDRENLQGEPLVNRFEIVGQDGTTDDGKPYFRIPPGPKKDLEPHDQSLPVNVRIRNRDYVSVFTPSFRVYGQKRLPADVKQPAPPGQPQGPGSAASTSPAAASKVQVDKLIQLLIKKGVITEEEWRKATQP